MRRVMITSVILVSLAAAPVAAQAQDPSGIDQYQENIPGAGGDQPGGHNGGGNAGGGHNGGGGSAGGGSAAGGSTLSPQVTDELNAHGADGAAAAAIAESTSPQGSGSGGSGSGANASGGGNGNGNGDSGSASQLNTGHDGGGLGGVVDEILGRNASNSDGMGVALPIILLATALGAVAFFLLARRRGPNEPGNA